MALNQIRHQFTEQLAQRHVWPLGRTATILVVGLAGLIHLSLIREHFEEQFVYGLVFTILALFQFTLALLLAVRPGPAVYRLGIWGSGLIVLVYVATRLIPLPGASVPEEVDVLGIAATGLEIAAVLLLTVALPEPAAARRPRGAPLWWGFAGAVVFAHLWLILTGVIQWTSEVYTSPLTWVGIGSWSALLPILAGSPLPHFWLAAPWWSLPAAFVLAVLVGLNLGCSTSLLMNGYESSRGRRARLLGLLPVGLATPVCCTASTPLLALLGVPLFLGVMAAPFAALLSAVLLSLSLVALSVQGAHATCTPGDSRGEGASRKSARRRNRGTPRSFLETIQEGGSHDHASRRGRMARHPADCAVLRTAAAAAPLLWETQGRWTERLALRDMGGAPVCEGVLRKTVLASR
jgi:hypothetical protein